MRLPPLPPESLDPERRAMHDAIARRVAKSLPDVVSLDRQGALIGPFPPLLHFPRFGEPAWHFLESMVAEAKLPGSVREVAILTVGAAFGARYEIYAHERMAEAAGLSPAAIATLAVGGRAADLSEAEGLAYEMASALANGHILPSSTYARAVQVLGREGLGELVFLIGGYCLISMLLNAFDTPVPDADRQQPRDG